MPDLNSFPKEYVCRMESLLKEEAPSFFDACMQEPVRGLRLRSAGEKVPPDAQERVPWAECANYLAAGSRIGSGILHEAGAFYLQEPSAMAAVSALSPEPGEMILDLCAAPGGKSTQIGSLLQGRGLLVANEPVPSRAAVLSMNLERMGIENACAVCAGPGELSAAWPGFFDRVLVDAPCSGEGMFRKDPAAILEWKPDTNARCAARQREILEAAAGMVRPGGVMVYSTCTFSPMENEENIAWFLSVHPEYELVPFALNGLPPCGGMLRLYPHRCRGEGHFVAKLRRTDGDKRPAAKTGNPDTVPIGSRERERLDPWLKELALEGPMDRLALFRGRVVRLPEALPPLRGIRVLRLGLEVGEEKPGYIVPAHALALARRSAKTAVLTEEQARQYQHGDTIPFAGGVSGWVQAVYQDHSLGWCKAVGDTLKNHYPKGLRSRY